MLKVAQDTVAQTETAIAATDTVGLDISTLSVKELSDMLAKARQAEKAKAAQESSLPMFAFAMITTDSPTPVYWSGRAVDDTAARALALTHAGPTVFVDSLGVTAIMPRPVPGPRGRKAKVDVIS